MNKKMRLAAGLLFAVNAIGIGFASTASAATAQVPPCPEGEVCALPHYTPHTDKVHASPNDTQAAKKVREYDRSKHSFPRF